MIPEHEVSNIAESLTHLPRFVVTNDGRNNGMKVYEKARLVIDSKSKYDPDRSVELYIAGIAINEKDNEPYGIFISSFFIMSKDGSRVK